MASAPGTLVKIRLNDGNVGDHPVVGDRTKTNYGYRKSGDIFLVDKVDQEARPSVFSLVEEEQQAEVEDEPPSEYDDLTELWGIGEERAEDLRSRGINTFADLAEMEEGELAGIVGKAAAKRAIEEAQEK